MPKKITVSALRGAKTFVADAELFLKKITAEKGGRTAISFPETSYYLPIILGMTGKPIEKISDLEPIMLSAHQMLKTLPGGKTLKSKPRRVPDAGMSALFAAEALGAIEYADEANEGENESRLDGPIDDFHVRSWGIELLSGRMPGIAVILGSAKTSAVALRIVQELRRRNILCFLGGDVDGRSIVNQLQEEGLEPGRDTYVVPCGTGAASIVHALGFTARIALMFGGFRPGKRRSILSFSKRRVSGFVLALGEMNDRIYATATGAIHFGFPLITDSAFSHLKPKSGAAEAKVLSIPFDSLAGKDDSNKAEQLVQKCIKACGMKVKLPKVEVPVQYGTAFDGEMVSDQDVRIEFGGSGSRCFELLQMANLDKEMDGKVEVLGPDFSNAGPNGSMDLGIVVNVAGRKMQGDFESHLERQIKHFINCAEGIQVAGQRDHTRIRISNEAARKGFCLESIGRILQARFHEDFGTIVDKVHVTLITEPSLHSIWLEKARKIYQDRDQRLASLTDDGVKEFYSCTLCQSFAMNHVCLISPERPGLCGKYDWLGSKASHKINPTGSIQPIKLGRQIDVKKGRWEGTNKAVKILSHGVVNEVSMYSIMDKPMTACCSSECIAMLIPEANGVMVVSREDASTTPAGMTFSTLACISGGSPQTPGMMGTGKSYLTSPKFISAEGGFKRVVWMSSILKENMSDGLKETCAQLGDPDLLDKIADEKNATSVEELLAWLKTHKHPALSMEPMF